MGITRRDGAIFGLGFLTGLLASFAALVLFSFVFLWMSRSLMEETPTLIAEKDRKEAPTSWSVTDLEGHPLPIESLRGRVVFVNFWATWCGPCREELPSIEKLADRLKDTPVAMLCISREEPAVVSAFLKKEGTRIPAYTMKDDPPPALKHDGIPTTFVFDRQGRIAVRTTGSADWADAGLVATIRSLALAPTHGPTGPSPTSGTPPASATGPAPASRDGTGSGAGP